MTLDHPSEPFAPVMCCDEHHEQEIRSLVLARLGGSMTPRLIAAHAGVAADDLARFITGQASLTWHSRERVRAKVVER